MSVEEDQPLRLKGMGEVATIPNNDIAKLMFYFSCIEQCSTLTFGKFSKYSDYRDIVYEDLLEMVELANLFTPRKLYEINAFMLAGDETIEAANEFFAFDKDEFKGTIDENISIGKYKGKLNLIMVYKSIWAETFYYAPLSNISASIKEHSSPESCCLLL
jgi:hypothetical protein